MKKEILNYLEYLHSELDDRPQCSGVFYLLAMRFPRARCYYDNDHIITLIDGRFYDWDGEVKDWEEFIPMEKYGDNWIIQHFNILTKKV